MRFAIQNILLFALMMYHHSNSVVAQNKAVGLSMAGKHAVSETGSSTYSIPLSLPKGTAGMEPTLGLVYSSQGGEGPLGIGWNISGLGAITRTGKTLYHDQVSKGVQLDGTDNFALDGQRLISTGSNEWMAEVAGFDKVSMVNGNALTTNTASFVVRTKNQQTIYYGANADARQIAPGTGQVIAWYITKIEDAYGNYTEYQYNNDAAKGEVNISRISYTGNKKAKLRPYVFVNFHYTQKRIDSISATIQDKLYRGYSLKYDSLERVVEILEHNTAGEWMKSQFEWGGPSPTDKIVGFSNHLGACTKVEYEILKKQGAGKTRLGLSYPLEILDTSMLVVSKVWATGDALGDSRINVKTYAYHTPVFHLRGKGFLGFRKLEVSEAARQKKTTTIQCFDGTYGLTLPCSTIVATRIDQNTVVSTSIVNEHIIHTLGSGRIFPYPFKTTKTDNTNGPITIESTASTNSTDLQQGNINGSVTKYFRGSTLDETVETYSVYDYAGHWGGRVTIAHKSTTRGGQVFNEAKGMTYNAQGSPIESLDHYYLSAAEQVKTKYGYDAFGNNIFTQIEAQGLLPRDKHIEYDPQGRFEIESVNAKQQMHVQTVDPFTGQVTQRTDPNGLTTEMTYDNWGRNTMTKSPDGVKVLTEYLDAAGMTHAPGMGSSFLDRQAVYAIRQQTQGLNNAQVTFYNRHGRKLREVSKGFTGQDVLVDYEYDDWGRLSGQTEPYFANAGGNPTKTITEYDLLNRPTLVQVTNGGQLTSIDYDNAYGVQSNTGAQFKKITKDATGKTTEQSDNGGTVKYTYHPNGKPSSVDAMGALTKLEYDARGFQTMLNEPNSGVTNYRYNAFGELAWQKDSKPTSTSAPISTNGEYTMTYDVLGRLVHKHGNEGDYVTEYDPNNATGQVAEERFIPSSPQFGQDVQYIYEYDQLSRLETQTEDLGGEVVKTTHWYDNFSRVVMESKTDDAASVSYGIHVKEYNAQGYLKALKPFTFAEDATSIWECLARNAKGQATQERMQNGLVTTRGYDVLGRPSLEQIKDGTSVFRHWQYTFDEPTGNLLNRTDVSRGLSETFEYDNLDRLISIGGALAQALTMNYAANGNITRKSDAAQQFIYDNVQPHQVTEVRGLVPDFPLEEQTIEYTPFNSTNYIKEGASRYRIFYGPDEQRVKSVLERPDFDDPSVRLTQTRYYASNLEITVKGNSKKTHYYINSDERNVAVYETDGADAWNYYFVHTDYLGSPLLFTRIDKVVKEEHSHDAWGRYRNPDDWTYTGISPETYTFARGYTGHEYLAEFGLVNMNGRCYDPLLGRMLGVDNFAHDDAGTQGHNRYSYVFNNPLKYTDASGEDPITITAIIVGALIGAYLNGANANDGSFAFWNWEPNLRTFGYMIVGGVAGGLGAAWAAPLAGTAAFLPAIGAAGAVSLGGTLLVDGVSAATGGYASHWSAKEWLSNSYNAFMAGASGAFVGSAFEGALGTKFGPETFRGFFRPFSSLSPQKIAELSTKEVLTNTAFGGLLNSWGNVKNWRDGNEIEDAALYFGIGAITSMTGASLMDMKKSTILKYIAINQGTDFAKSFLNNAVSGKSYRFNLVGFIQSTLVGMSGYKYPIIKDGPRPPSWRYKL